MTPIPNAIAGFPQHTTEPRLTDAEVAGLERLYQAMENNHPLIVHVDESTWREQLAIDDAAGAHPLNPETFARHIDALRRLLRAQLAAYDRYEDRQTVERLRADLQEVPA